MDSRAKVSPQCRGNEGVLTVESLFQGDFFIAKGRANSKVLTSSWPSGVGAYSRSLKAGKS